jgi:hypothetical protein
MLHNQLLVATIRHYDEVLFWNNIIKSFVCMSDERFARAEYVQELLWTTLSAHWPEACAYATSHNHAVTIAFHL